MDPWDLPGPAALLEEGQRAIAGNAHVAFIVPGLTVARWLPARVRSWSPVVQQVSVEPGQTLIMALADHFQFPLGNRVNLRELWKHQPDSGPGLAGTLVWVSGANPREFGAAAAELTALNATAQPYEYATLMTAVSSWDESGHAALRTLNWSDYLGLLDVQFLVARLQRDRMPPLHLPFTSTLVAQLALYDLELAALMAGLEISELLEPDDLLKAIAGDRGWSVDTPPCEEMGSLGKIDQAMRLHSSYKVLQGSLGRRVWRAQVSALFPLLELERQAVVQTYGHLISDHLPLLRDYRGKTVNVETLDDVEFGDLHGLATKYSSKWPGDVADRIRYFKRIRDEMAHLQPLGRDAVNRLLG